MKKILISFLSALTLSSLLGCSNAEVEDPNVDVLPDLSQPTVKGKLYHWMPNSSGANVTATLKLNDASLETITFNDVTLRNYIDYEINGENLTIFGDFLKANANTVGKHNFKINTTLNDLNFEVQVVLDPAGTSIQTKEIEGINMSGVVDYTPTTVIQGAPDLLITELGMDNGMYDYIEVFNNTTSEYNLENHRIVFADTSKSTNINDSLIFTEAYGNYGSAFIYEEYKIQPLSSAYIWVYNESHWTIESSTRELLEKDTVQNAIFGDDDANLNYSKFRDIFGLSEDEDVFFVRTHNILFNNTASPSEDTGLGIPVAKSAVFSSNTKVNNRGVQIQKVDVETTYSIDDDTNLPAGAVGYKYEHVVVNKVEDLYATGTLNKELIETHGGRQSINAYGIKKAYYNNEGEFLGYSKINNIDMYNAPTEARVGKLFEESITPIVSAYFYANIILDENSANANERWGSLVSMEYTIPESGSHLMRFIARSHDIDAYKALWGTADETILTLRTSGIHFGIEDVQNTTIVVPVDSAYDIAHLITTNTIGKNAWFNFSTVK